MPAVTRAKFVVQEITTRPGSVPRDDIEYDQELKHWVNKETREKHEGKTYRDFDVPTIAMLAVGTGNPENDSFFQASPSGRLEITIANPRAAELFQLRDEYYLDFIQANGETPEPTPSGVYGVIARRLGLEDGDGLSTVLERIDALQRIESRLQGVRDALGDDIPCTVA